MLIKDENDNLVQLVDLQGKFVKELGEFGGKIGRASCRERV